MNPSPPAGEGGRIEPQVLAADPKRSVFVSANAGSGKTKTLVDRVARLLLNGARPEAILCVTYTKAAAAEMQRRLFGQLGGWAVLDDAALRAELAKIGEGAGDLSRARTLFAHALEAPGGLKIETLHAFCEKLLRRFPLEAGVSPGFQVMDDAASAVASGEARDALARLAMAGQAQVAAAYAAMAARLDFGAFEDMFTAFEGKREVIAAYLRRIGGLGGLTDDVAARCGLPPGPVDLEAMQAAAVAPPALDLALWREAAAVLAGGSASDQKAAARMGAVAEAAAHAGADFAEAVDILLKDDGEARKWVASAAVLKGAPALQVRLQVEQDRVAEAVQHLRAARIAEATVHVLTLAGVYVDRFEAAKRRRGWLDFTDLTVKARALLEDREDAAWVLYKLDGGVEHVLLDEAQDTAPDQWDILSALTGEFFAGAGAAARAQAPLERTVFLVGDEKQSIYSFQGARPERLAQEADRYEALATAAGRPFARAPLLVSYRSAPQVLDYVDTVFAPDAARAALQPRAPGALASPELVRHIAHRAADHGTLDLWELEREVDDEDRRAWDAPLDDKPTSAYRRLAERIAAEIAALVARGDAVHDRAGMRPARFGDVLILVRKRKALFEELLRACKHAGVPVAGADRLKLSEHPVFADLMALTRTALFPQDDLSLAEVLRSPFCDVDEAGLYALARGSDGGGRSGSLWSELTRRADETPAWRGALDLIGWMREQAGTPAFIAYSRLLARLDHDGHSMRQRIVTRLGAEAGDAVDEILAQALAAESRGVFDLERFADQAGRLDITVKREMDAPHDGATGGEVRIMTAHSAKGLEAPIVFLPETVGANAGRGSLLMSDEDGGFLWCSSSKADCSASAAMRARREAAEAAESLRLLYVALTRARDRVVIAGRINARAKLDTIKGWWAPMAEAFESPALTGQVRELMLDGRAVRRFGPHPAPLVRVAAEVPPPSPLPPWAQRFAPAEDGPSGAAAPSSAATARGPAPSPLSSTLGLGRFRRGELIHRLLQLLPDLAPTAWDEAAARLLAKERDLDEDQRTEMATAALGVLRDARFAEVFGPGSRAEAAVAGTAPDLPPGYAVSGRVDRMVVSAERVLVVDFKTNRPAPDRIEDTDPTYIAQIALYAAVLRAIFPGRVVEGALVWTDGPKLMAVPEAMMAQSLKSVH